MTAQRELARAGLYATTARGALEQRDIAIMRAHNAGASLRDIAYVVGLTYQAVHHIVRRDSKVAGAGSVTAT